MQFFLFFIAFYGFLLFIQYWVWIKPVFLIPVSPANYSLCLYEDVPNLLKEQLSQGIKDFEPLGFQVSHYLKYHEFYASINTLKYAVILFNPEYNCYLAIENNFQPDSIRPYNTTFHVFTNQEMFSGYYLENTLFLFPNTRCINVLEEDISKRFQVFLDFVHQKEKLKPENRSLKIDAKEHCSYLNKIKVSHHDELIRKGLLKLKKTTMYFTLRGAIKFGFRVKNTQDKATKKERKLKYKLTPQPCFIIGAQTNAYQRSMKVNDTANFKNKGKVFVLFFSVLVFFVLFGLALDFEFALLLISILFIHELGHLLAMKAFSYRNLQMVFMPFGALAIGQNTGVAVLKRVIISLAGPVPGIILGFYIGLSPSINHYSWSSEAAFMLVVINYFNLLPFYPLDGGQVINHTLFARYPKLQLAFFSLSAVAFVSFAVYSKEPIMGAVSLFLMYSLFYQIKNFKIYSKLNQINDENKKPEQLINKMFTQLSDEPMRYRQKFYTIFSSINIISMPKAKFYEILLGLLLYLTALYTPIYFINQYTDGSFWTTLGIKENGGKNNAFDEKQYEPDYWRKKLAKNIMPTEKFDIYILAMHFIDSEKYDKSYEAFINEALIFAKQNKLTTHHDYPELLKNNIIFPLWKSEDIKLINKELLEELKNIDGGENIQYAELILDLTYLQIDEDKLEEIEKAISIFKKFGDEYFLSEASQVKAIILSQKQEYQKAESTLLKIIAMKELIDFSSESLLIELYQTTNQLTKSKSVCLKFIEQERKFGKSGLLESCAWTELLNKDFNQAEKYFNDAATLNEEDFINAIKPYIDEQETIDDLLAYQRFNANKNFFVLEWSKGNTKKAGEILKRFDGFKKTFELNIDEQIKSIKKSKHLSPKFKLLIKAYDEIRNSIKNNED